MLNWMTTFATAPTGWGGWPFGWNTSLQTGIAHYWKCDLNGSFPDEVWGNTWTLNWPTFRASWKINWDYDYDNANDYVAITALASWIKSLSMWAQKEATGQFGRVMWNTAWTMYLFQLWNDGKNYSNLWVWTISFSQTDDTNYHHYVITTDGVNVRLYNDWVLQITTAYTGDLSWFDQIWKYTTVNAPTNLWNWPIDEIWGWTKTLTAQDVTDLYNSWTWLSY